MTDSAYVCHLLAKVWVTSLGYIFELHFNQPGLIIVCRLVKEQVRLLKSLVCEAMLKLGLLVKAILPVQLG